MSKRKSLSKKVRFDVFKRDGFACHYCGATPPKALLHVDHIHPVAEGGDNSEDNLITACDQCNWGKGAVLLSCLPESLKDKAARIKEAEEQLSAYMDVVRAKRDRIEGDAWRVVDIWCETYGGDCCIRRDYFRSIKRFVEKLGVVEVEGAMDYATQRIAYSPSQCFRYFAGICWNKIKEGEE